MEGRDYINVRRISHNQFCCDAYNVYTQWSIKGIAFILLRNLDRL